MSVSVTDTHSCCIFDSDPFLESSQYQIEKPKLHLYLILQRKKNKEKLNYLLRTSADQQPQSTSPKGASLVHFAQ